MDIEQIKSEIEGLAGDKTTSFKERICRLEELDTFVSEQLDKLDDEQQADGSDPDAYDGEDFDDGLDDDDDDEDDEGY